jgi:hypothetical protein
MPVGISSGFGALLGECHADPLFAAPDNAAMPTFMTSYDA